MEPTDTDCGEGEWAMRYEKPVVMDLDARPVSGWDPEGLGLDACLTGNGASAGSQTCATGHGAKLDCTSGSSNGDGSTPSCVPGGAAGSGDCLSGTAVGPARSCMTGVGG